MKNLNTIAEDLFNKIRGRFSSVTIGTSEGKVTDEPALARFYDFDYKADGSSIGKVSISLDENKLSVMYTNNFVKDKSDTVRKSWYQFLRELRSFAKKRLLQFDTRDITKSNLDRRDYQFLAKKSGSPTMSESKLYGTSKMSYQNIGNARLNLRHRKTINTEEAGSRTRSIDSIYIESSEGERFKYPYRHLAGARAMARHVSEGGNPYDDFGRHITGLSEELNKLRKFKTYLGRSSVMAESLSQYMDIIEGRAKEIKNEIANIQKANRYNELVENFESVSLEEVPEDVKANWIDELTIKQFNEELQDIFPYIYRLIGEGKKAQEITPDNLDEEFEMGDDVHIKSRNITGMYYGEKDGEIIVKTPNGLETADPEDVEQVDSESQEAEEQQLPITEFILSQYDRETGSWPRGETAVLTGVEKDYGESFIEPAKQFIERVNQTFEQYSEGTRGKTHISPSGVETDMDPSDDDYEINYGKHGAAAEDENTEASYEACDCEDDKERDTDEDFERLKNLAGL